MYLYRLTNTNESSQKYGECEVCGKHVSEVFSQQEERSYQFEGRERWTQHKCHCLFGHKECLLCQRKA